MKDDNEVTRTEVIPEKFLTVRFSLPGVSWSSRGSMGAGQETQLEQGGYSHTERWTLKVGAGNVRATAERLREVAGELDKAAEVLA